MWFSPGIGDVGWGGRGGGCIPHTSTAVEGQSKGRLEVFYKELRENDLIGP